MQKIGTIALVSVIAVGVSACSTPANKSEPSMAGHGNIGQERVLVQNFKRQGIRIESSALGDIKAIEVTGFASVWGNTQSALESAYKVAELDAKKKLVDFVYRETITTQTSVAMLTKLLELGRQTDLKDRPVPSPIAELSIDDSELTADPNHPNPTRNRTEDHRAIRIASILNQSIRSSNAGILGGLRIVDQTLLADGKLASVTYRWEEKWGKNLSALRDLMSR